MVLGGGGNVGDSTRSLQGLDEVIYNLKHLGCGLACASLHQGSGVRNLIVNTLPFFAYLHSTHQGGSFGAKKKKIDRGNPKLEHGQRLVNDQTCLNK